MLDDSPTSIARVKAKLSHQLYIFLVYIFRVPRITFIEYSSGRFHRNTLGYTHCQPPSYMNRTINLEIGSGIYNPNTIKRASRLNCKICIRHNS